MSKISDFRRHLIKDRFADSPKWNAQIQRQMNITKTKTHIYIINTSHLETIQTIRLYIFIVNIYNIPRKISCTNAASFFPRRSFAHCHWSTRFGRVLHRDDHHSRRPSRQLHLLSHVSIYQASVCVPDIRNQIKHTIFSYILIWQGFENYGAKNAHFICI